MTYRHLAPLIAVSGLTVCAWQPAAFAQVNASTPALTAARNVPSHISPGIKPAFDLVVARELVPTTPADQASAVSTTAPAGLISSPNSSSSVVSGPRRTVARMTNNIFLSATAPKVPEVASATSPDEATPVAKVASPTLLQETEDEKADRLLLAKLEADLNATSARLDRAKDQLDDGQKSLDQFTGELQRAMAAAGADSRGLNPFVRVAQRYKGTPYVWGGVSARGFDCSGFIIRVMQDLGYRSLPHSAAEQFRYGQPVAQALLKPGDLVFFANTYKPGISHVGIYLGNRRFIHAANSHDGTIVSTLDAAKWQEKYAGARRLMPVKARRG